MAEVPTRAIHAGEPLTNHNEVIMPQRCVHQEFDTMGKPWKPVVFGSPMRTPLGSPSAGPELRPPGEVPTLSLDEDDANALQAAIEASLGDDMKRRLQSSLKNTEQELLGDCVEAASDIPRDYKRARLRSASELDAAVSDVETTSCLASPSLGPANPSICVADDRTSNHVHQVPMAVLDCESSSSCFPAQVLPPADQPAPMYEFEGLLDHEMLLETLYAAQGIDLRVPQEQVTKLLEEVGLRCLDLGVKNHDENGREMVNQCFYLSIARSYLGPIETAEVEKAALLMKRTVEACVLAAHPEWADDAQKLGENAMAFADFLPIAMGVKDPPNLMSKLAVVILDATQCHAEVYLGPRYSKEEGCSGSEDCREDLERNLVLLCYTPGHYKALVKDDVLGSKPPWTYGDVKEMLDKRGVMCIETYDFD